MYIKQSFVGKTAQLQNMLVKQDKNYNLAKIHMILI